MCVCVHLFPLCTRDTATSLQSAQCVHAHHGNQQALSSPEGWALNIYQHSQPIREGEGQGEGGRTEKCRRNIILILFEHLDQAVPADGTPNFCFV